MDLYGPPVVHRVPWRGGILDFSTYEIGLIARLASGKFVPVEGAPQARKLVERLEAGNVDAAELLQAIIALGVDIPEFEIMDGDAFARAPYYQLTIEGILTEHLDRWREIDDPDGAHSLRKKAQR